jgi:hypothetical protein
LFRIIELGDLGAPVRRHLPRLRFVLDDLTQVSERGLRARRHLTAMAKVAQGAVKDLRSGDPAAFIHRWGTLLRAVGFRDITALWHYVAVMSTRESREEAAMAMQAELGKTGRDAVVTIADSYRAEGRAEEAVRAVLAVFEARDMEVPDEVRVRIEACDDPELLEVWLKRAVKVDSPEGILAE